MQESKSARRHNEFFFKYLLNQFQASRLKIYIIIYLLLFLVLSERAYLTCKCLPSCTDFDYTLSYSMAPKNFSYIKDSLTFLNSSIDR